MDLNKEKYYSQETQQQIDGYLLGTLNADELAEFQKKMELDPMFKKAVQEQKLLLESVEEYNLRQSLNVLHSAIKQENSKKTQYSWIAVAAFLAIIIGLTSWALFFNTNSAEKVFAKNFEPDPGLPTTMGTSSNYDFYEGMVSYKRKKYQKALVLWQSLYSKNNESDTLNYFMGVAHLANGEALKAEKYLYKASEQPKSIFYEEAQYYLALSQIKEGKILEAKQTLANSTSPKNSELREQVEKLD